MTWNTEMICRLFASLALAIGALGSAIPLYRFSAGSTRRRLVATLLIIGSTAVVTGLQFVFPEVLANLRRNREALLAGEWWRTVTPLFVHAYGWWHAGFNGTAAIIFCPVAERLFGKRLLILYFVPGVVGQIFGYLWSPYNAGASLGIVGVIGGLFGFIFWRRRELGAGTLVFALAGLAGAAGLCLTRDIHGPPTILGFLLAGLLLAREGKSRSSQPTEEA